MEKNTVQVVDVNNDVKVAEITVGKEPNTMVVDKNNHVWVLCEGATWQADGENSAYVEGGNIGRLIRKAWNTIKKKDPKAVKEVKDSLKKIGNQDLGNGMTLDYLKHIGTDTVVLGGNGKLSDADVLAHELGHSLYDHKGRSKDIIGKAAHATMFPSKILTDKVLNTKAGTVGMAAIGFRSGMKSAERKAKGENDTIWNKTKSVAIPLAITAPTLIGEAAASRQGIKMLKKHGASKDALKIARKSLAGAWGTYAAKDALKPIVVGEGSRLVGKGVGTVKYKKRKENKDNSED